MKSTFYKINEAISVYSILLAIFGTIGNILTIIICSRKKLRKVPTFVFIAFLAICDTLSLYFWNFNDYFLTYHDLTIGDYSLMSCRITTILQYIGMHSSAFLLVIISIDRYLSVKIKLWRSLYFNYKHAICASIVTIMIFFLLNIHLIETIKFDKNSTIIGRCASSDIFQIWRNAHIYLYSIIPFTILAIFNGMLLYHVMVNKSKVLPQRKLTKKRSLSFMVVALTISFVALTAPFAITGSLSGQYMIFTQHGRIMLYVLVEIALTYHGSNFLVLLLTNTEFSKEFKKCFNELKISTFKLFSATNKVRNQQ